MKISYAVTVCNEFVEIQKLIPLLLKLKRSQDEIVILYDSKNGDKGVDEFLRAKSINSEIIWHSDEFNKHFADWKNKLSGFCTGDYIFQIDADELVSESLINNLPDIFKSNPESDVFLVPRINTVEGLTDSHIAQWNWQVNEKGWVNFPDYQYRIWKNNKGIFWVNKVHEKLNGYDSFTVMPANENYCIIHPKSIDKQEKQNSFYATL